MLELIVPASKIFEGNEPLPRIINPWHNKNNTDRKVRKKEEIVDNLEFVGSYMSHFTLTIKNSSPN